MRIYLLLRRALRAWGHEVRGTTRANEAMKKIQEFRPDLVVTDIMMPYVSGLALLKTLREMPETAETPVIACSAYDANREIVEKLGGHWMSKPWDRDELAVLTGRLLGCSVDLARQGGRPLETAVAVT